MIIMYGDPSDGLNFVGPFVNGNEATEFAHDFISVSWWVVDIESPKEYLKEYEQQN